MAKKPAKKTTKKKQSKELTPRQIEVRDLFFELNNVSEVARQLGTTRQNIQNILKSMNVSLPKFEGTISRRIEEKFPLPPEGQVRRYILTSGQNNTRAFSAFVNNLEVLAERADAQIMCSRFTYNKSKFGKKSVKPGSLSGDEQDELWYAEEVEMYSEDRNIELAPRLIFWGRWNQLPTSANPLAGLDSHGGEKDGIFPHVRFEKRSIATLKGKPAKKIYTTGGITTYNYVQKNAGLKAEFYHCFGALMVEVRSDGEHYVHHINADSRGNFYFLFDPEGEAEGIIKIENGEVYYGYDAEALNPGDLHASEVDETVLEAVWGDKYGTSLIDHLNPKYQFLHDVLSFNRRSHHDMRDPHLMYEKFIEGEECVMGELHATKDLIQSRIEREGTQTVVVRSNHDCHFEQWLRDNPAAYARDPVNAELFLEAQLAKYRSIKERDRSFKLIEWAMIRLGLDSLKFLDEDESFIICGSSGGGVECGMHGHLGLNGARGNPRSLSKLGNKCNLGHYHSSGIFGGAYVAGTCSKMDLGYNLGPGNWSHTMLYTFPNGKRGFAEIKADGSWRA